MGNALVKQGKIGVSPQAAWGTASASTYNSAKYNASTLPMLDNAPTLEAREMVGDSSVTSAVGRSYFDGEGSLKTLSFESYLNVGTLPDHVGGALQDFAAVTNLYTYSPEDSVIDFQANEGNLYSIYKQWGSTSADPMLLLNAIIGDITFSLDNTASGVAHLMTMSGNWTGTKIENMDGAEQGVVNVAGDYSISESNEKWYLIWNDGVDTYTDTCFYNFSLNISNNVEGVCKGAGNFRNYRIKPTMTVTFDVPHLTAMEGATQQAFDGAEMSFSLRNYSGTLDPSNEGEIQFQATNMICTASPVAESNGYESISIQAELLRNDTTGWSEPLISFYTAIS